MSKRSRNADLNYEEWSDGLHLTDSATEGTQGNSNKRQIIYGTTYTGYLPVVDVFDFFKQNPVWYSKRQGALQHELYCEDDVFIFSSAKVPSTCKLRISEAKLVVPKYDITQDLHDEIMKMQQVVMPYEAYKVKSFLLSTGANSFSWEVGVDNLVGLKIMFRDRTTEAIGNITTPTCYRNLTRSADVGITSLQIKCGNWSLEEIPLTSKVQLWRHMKEFYLIHHDTDVGSLINKYNFESDHPTISEDQKALATTQSHHLAFDLSKNGVQTGINAKQSTLDIDISVGSVSSVYMEVYAIYSAVDIEVGGNHTVLI